MYSPSIKHSLTPNQFMKPQRDHSPSHKHSNKNKYYSTEEVSKMIKSYLQPKIYYLQNELDDKQKTIQILNQKLDQNDEKLKKLYKVAEGMYHRQKQLEQQQNKQPIQIISQMVDERIKQCWQAVNISIQRLKETVIQSKPIDLKKIQNKLLTEIQKIRKQTYDYIEQSKTKSNNYWLKIKEALNRINSKIMKTDETILQATSNFTNYRNYIQQSEQYLIQLQKSRKMIKKFIDLRKSVQNIYSSYEELLVLQNHFKNHLNQFNTYQINHYQEEHQLNNLCKLQDKLKNYQPKQILNYLVKYSPSQDLIEFSQSRLCNKIQQEEKTFPILKKNQSLDLNQLQYSTNQDKTIQKFRKTPLRTNQNHSKDLSNNFIEDNFVLEYSKDDNPSEMLHAPLSSKAMENQNGFIDKYFVPNVRKKSGANLVMGMLSPSKISTESGRWEQCVNSPNELSCLNSSTNAQNRHGSRSTFFVNLSIENRQQMSESIKQRLQQMISMKDLIKPLTVYVDEINYLKNNEGNYLFDTRGNMFKVSVEEGKNLEKLGIIKLLEKGNFKQISRENIKESLRENHRSNTTSNLKESRQDCISGKKNSLLFGNTNSSSSIDSKVKNQGIASQKIKSISIKQAPA